MTDIKIGTKVRVIGSPNHYFVDGAVGEVIGFWPTEQNPIQYEVLGVDKDDGRPLEQYLLPLEFEILPEDFSLPAPKNHYELLDELAILVGIPEEELRWGNETCKRRVLQRAIKLIKELSNKP